MIGIIYINKLHSIVVTTFFIGDSSDNFPVKDIVILGVTNISIPMFFPSSNKSSECIRPPPRLISEMDAYMIRFLRILSGRGSLHETFVFSLIIVTQYFVYLNCNGLLSYGDYFFRNASAKQCLNIFIKDFTTILLPSLK